MTKPVIEVFVSDVHFPFEDPHAWKLTLKMLHAIQPSIIFLGGDIVDCYAVSKFEREASRVLKLQEELDRATEGIAQLRAIAPKAQMFFMPGNHEWRMERFKNKVLELSGLRSLNIEELLHLRDLKITPLPRFEGYRIGQLWHFHGDEAEGGSVYPARTVYNKQQGNQIMGHYHKAQVHYNRLLDGSVHGSWINPCLCKLKQEYIKGLSQWQQGFTVVEYLYDGLFHVEQVVFFEYQGELIGVWRDKTFRVPKP